MDASFISSTKTISVSDAHARPLFLQGVFIELDSGAAEELHSATG